MTKKVIYVDAFFSDVAPEQSILDIAGARIVTGHCTTEDEHSRREGSQARGWT